MSTKVYDAFELTLSDLAAIHEWIQGWRAIMRDAHTTAVARYLADRATWIIDKTACSNAVPDFDIDLRNEKRSGSPLQLADRELQGGMKKIQSGYRSPQEDFEFRLTVIPFEGRIFLKAACEQRDWVKAFQNDPALRDFSFWNNTDPPPNISHRDWAERGRIWDAIDKVGHGNLLQSGFVVDLVDLSRRPYPSCVEVLALAPSFEDRLRRMINRAGVLLALREDPNAELEFSRRSSAPVLRAGDRIQTDQVFRSRVERLIRPLLPIEITTDMLNGIEPRAPSASDSHEP